MADGEDREEPDLRVLAEHLPFDVWARDRDDRVVYMNAAARSRWGLEIGQRLEARPGVEEATVAVWRANNQRALAGEIVRGEVEYYVDGRPRRFLNVIAPFGPREAFGGTVGMNVEITDLRDSEARAALLDRTLRDLFLHAPIAIGIRGVKGTDLLHIDDNPQAAALLGVLPDALRGKTDRELGADEAQIAGAIALFRRARKLGRPVEFEMKVQSAAGGARAMTGKLVPLPGETTGDERFAFFGEDVTRLRSLEAGLNHADRLASLGVIAASIGHEIKNPAAYAAAHLRLILDRLEAGPVDEDARQSLIDGTKTAQHGLDRIVALTRNMMGFASPRDASLGPVELRDVVDSVIKLAGGEIRGRARLIRSDGNPPMVLGNATRLAQVVLNLVSNALNAFGERRGCLWIETDAIPGDLARITIADDGPGLPLAIRARLFEPFVTSTNDAGNGLGLFVSHDIVRSMGGSLTVAERDGGGTVFRIDVPVYVDPTRQSVAPAGT